MRAAAVAAPPSRRLLRRPVVGAAAAVAAAGLLAGCTGSGGAATAAGAPRQVASPAAATTPAGTGTAGTADTSAELARGLLPADAFGPGATVVPVSLAELQQRLAAVPGGIGAALAGVTVTPTPCAAALEGVGAGLAGVDGLAGEGARTGSGGTAEALVTGGPVTTAVGTVTDLVTACPHVEVSSPHGSATVDLAPVDLAALRVPALGDGAAAVRATAVLTPAAATGRAPVTVSGLLAVVRDHDRLLLLGTAAPGATAPDDASFASLLQQAYATAHALG